jgi:hypothetical protein
MGDLNNYLNSHTYLLLSNGKLAEVVNKFCNLILRQVLVRVVPYEVNIVLPLFVALFPCVLHFPYLCTID